MKLAGKIALLGLVALPLIAAGQTPPAPTYNSTITGFNSVTSFINVIVGGWIFWLLMVFVVIFILYAAFLYLTSGGDPEKTGKAKGVIIYAVIALAVALLAKAIVAIVTSALNS